MLIRLLTGSIHKCTFGSECPHWIGENSHLRTGNHSTSYSSQLAAATCLQSRLQYIWLSSPRWFLLCCHYTPWAEKTCHFTSVYIIAIYWPIFKILWLAHFADNLR